MKTSWISLLSAVGVLSIAGVASASSHREAPAISDDPAADNTDTYAWVQGTNLVVVAAYNGLELPEGGPNWAKFSDDVLYEIHVARGADSLDDKLTYQFRFNSAKPARADEGATPPLHFPATKGIEFFGQLAGSGAFNQTFTVTKLTDGANPTVITAAGGGKVPPPNVGPATNVNAYQTGGASYEAFFVDSGKSTAALTGGGKAFAGPRDDPFWVDLGAIFDLAQLRPVANPTSTQVVRDSIAYMNVHAIVLEIPLKEANGGTDPVAGAHVAQTVGVWASSSRRKSTIRRANGSDASFGPWVQVSRLGLPLVNEAIIGLQDKDYWNRTTPGQDLGYFASYFLNPIAVRDAEVVGFYNTGGPLAGCTANGGTNLETGRFDIVGVINLGGDHTGAEKINSIGDVIRVDLGQASGFPNGRLLTDKVVDLVGLLLCGATGITAVLGNVGPEDNEAEAPLPKGGGTPAFPYLQTPWEGRTAIPRKAPSAAP